MTNFNIYNYTPTLKPAFFTTTCIFAVATNSLCSPSVFFFINISQLQQPSGFTTKYLYKLYEKKNRNKYLLLNTYMFVKCLHDASSRETVCYILHFGPFYTIVTAYNLFFM